MDNQTCKKRTEQLKANRSNVNGVLEKIEQYVVPFRGDYSGSTGSETSVEWTRRGLFDSTAVIANQNLAANLHSALTNPATRWYDFVFRSEQANQLQAAKIWLDVVGNTIFLSLQNSNFDLEINEVYLDLTSIGTALLAEEVIEDANGRLKRIDFKAMPVSQCYFECDSNGKVVNFYRELEWTALQIKEKFGVNNLSSEALYEIEAKQPDHKFPIIFSVYKREVGGEDDIYTVLSPDARPYGAKYFLSQSLKSLGDEVGYYEMPIFAPKWRKTTGSEMGHSPAMVVLPDILTLNELVEMTLVAAEKAIDPPVLARRRGVFGDVDLASGGVTTVSDMEAIKVFESKARFDVGELNKENLQRSIRQAYFMDQLELKESPTMTATEVQVRYELMQRLIGPTLGRLKTDLLIPLLERTMKILYRYKLLPELPAEVAQFNTEMDVVFTGPMARTHKLDKVAAIERVAANLAQLEAVKPGVMQIFDEQEAGREISALLNAPPRIIKSRAVVERERKAMQQQQEAAQQIQMAQQGGEALKSLGEGKKAMDQQAA